MSLQITHAKHIPVSFRSDLMNNHDMGALYKKQSIEEFLD